MKTIFIQYFWAFFAISILILSTSCTQQKSNDDCSNQIILGVNAYSFSDLLSARSNRDDQLVYSLYNLLDWCADQNIKAIDPTGYFFPTYPEVPSDAYIKKFKDRAAELGISTIIF